MRSISSCGEARSIIQMHVDYLAPEISLTGTLYNTADASTRKGVLRSLVLQK